MDLDLSELLAKARDVQAQAGRLQEKLSKQVVDASAGGGMVTARANGALEIVGIQIDPAVLDPQDLDMLQDLVVAACAAAQKKAREAASEEVSKLTGGMGMPDLGKLLGGAG